jgi:hypothetical protein
VGRAVTRHLTYAWIEYGNPLDGEALTDGLFSMGWRNAVRSFPMKKDAFGPRYIDAAHPLLPIRWRGSALLILPNDRLDKHGHGENPLIKDPIFEAFRKANGDPAIEQEIRNQNKFIAQWVFCPGVKKVSDAESRLTLDQDITDYVDLVAISGHGAAGLVWGGGDMANLSEALFFPLNPASDRLKYVIIASCFNVANTNIESWLAALRRDRPLHGVLGFGDAYPGDEVGKVIFQRFTSNLKAGRGSKTILSAWREAHADPHSKIWAALLHTESAKRDTMADWLAGKLKPPDKDGEIRWFDEKNFPDGKIATIKPPNLTVNFFMGSTKITAQNTANPDVGLFPGQKGALVIGKRPGRGTFSVGDTVTLVFYYYRPNKDGMNLNALLNFDRASDGVITLKTDVNKEDKTTFVDALEFRFTKAGLQETRLPYTVSGDSVKTYPTDRGTTHGYFNLKLTPPGETEGGSSDLRFYREGAWLHEAKP